MPFSTTSGTSSSKIGSDYPQSEYHTIGWRPCGCRPMFFHPLSNNSTAGLAMTYALGGKSTVLAEISAVLVENSASTADFCTSNRGKSRHIAQTYGMLSALLKAKCANPGTSKQQNAPISKKYAHIFKQGQYILLFLQANIKTFEHVTHSYTSQRPSQRRLHGTPERCRHQRGRQ